MTEQDNIDYTNDIVHDDLFYVKDDLLVSIEKLQLKEDINFIQHANENQWQKRRENYVSWPWKTNVFDFIREIYGPWLGKGLVQADLRSVDKPLYAEFHKRLSSMPEDDREDTLKQLKLPTASEARLAEIEDPVERAQRETVRAWWRAQKAASPRP